jgi:hypothetical protein
VGCYFVLFPKSRFDLVIVFLRWPVKTIQTYTHGAVGAWIGEQAILALLTQTVRFSSVAFWAHIGGFLTGAGATGFLLLLMPQLRNRGEQPLVVRFVKGTVRDMSGKPVVGASFELHTDFHPPFSVKTDTKGRFNMPPIPDGTYSFHVRKDTFQALTGTVVVRRKRRFPSTFNLTMTASTSEQIPAQAHAAPA